MAFPWLLLVAMLFCCYVIQQRLQTESRRSHFLWTSHWTSFIPLRVLSCSCAQRDKVCVRVYIGKDNNVTTCFCCGGCLVFSICLLFWEREEGREREEHQFVVALAHALVGWLSCALTRDQTLAHQDMLNQPRGWGRERNINGLPLTHIPTRERPATQACARTGNRTGTLSLCETTPNQLSHTGQGMWVISLIPMAALWVRSSYYLL